VPLPASLADKLEHAKRGSYQPITDLPNKFYFELNWNAILSGMDFFGPRGTPADAAPVQAVRPHLQALIERIYADEAEQPIGQDAWPDVDPGELDGGTGHPMWFPTW
jgi:hypothetical protein